MNFVPMSKIRIAAVSYINTYPFVEGLKSSDLLPDAELILDVPSTCAKSFIDKTCDIALLPVGAMQAEDIPAIFTPYCLGTNGGVKTVVLLSNCPVKKINRIFLDEDSSTSVQLIRILTKQHWNINPVFFPYNSNTIEKSDGIVLIGDKVFKARPDFKFCYDLSDEWFHYTGLPFVFAVWAKAKPISPDFESRFEQSLAFGLSKINNLYELYDTRGLSKQEMIAYLSKSMNYHLDVPKMDALKRFIDEKGATNAAP